MLSFHNMLSEKLTQLFHTWTHTWTRFSVWVAPFLPGKKCFPPTSSRCTNHTSILYLHHPFIFEKSFQRPLPPPPFYAPPQALPTEEAVSQTCADPHQQSMCPKLLNNLHTKIEWEKLALVTRDWHKSSNNKSHVLLHSYRGSTRILQLNFKGLFFSPSSGFRLSCLHFLVKQLTSTLKHLHALLPQYAVRKADTIIPYMNPYMNTSQRMSGPLPSREKVLSTNQQQGAPITHLYCIYTILSFLKKAFSGLFLRHPSTLLLKPCLQKKLCHKHAPTHISSPCVQNYSTISTPKLNERNWLSWLVTDTNQATTSRMSVCTATVAALASYNWISKASSSALLLASACLACTFWLNN